LSLGAPNKARISPRCSGSKSRKDSNQNE